MSRTEQAGAVRTHHDAVTRRSPLKETTMSKGQRGNKEAKKPKKAPAPISAPGAGESMPALVPAAQPRPRR